MNTHKRRHERSDVIIIVGCVKERLADIFFDGVVANISESGFCLLTTHPLSKDDTIIMKKKISDSSGRATVRWVDRSNKYYCKAGLEFV
jgi:hypothetical protein